MSVNHRYVVSSLRKVWMHSPERKAAKARAKLHGMELYLCRKCRRPHAKVEVNHVTPVGSVNSIDGWDGFISRLFCDSSGLEVLCKSCHRGETKAQNSSRKGRSR